MMGGRGVIFPGSYRCGVQVGTIDALLIQLCRKNDLTLLTTDQDFHAATKHVEFRLWSATWAASKTACIDPGIRRCLK